MIKVIYKLGPCGREYISKIQMDNGYNFTNFIEELLKTLDNCPIYISLYRYHYYGLKRIADIKCDQGNISDINWLKEKYKKLENRNIKYVKGKGCKGCPSISIFI